MKFFHSLKFKLLLILLSVALIPLIGSNLVQFSYNNTVTTADTKAQELGIAASNANVVNTWVLAKISQMAELLRAHPEYTHMDKTQILSGIRVLSQCDVDIEACLVSDSEGDASSDASQSINISGEEYFQKVKTTKKAAVSEVFKSKTTGHNVIYVAVPVLNYDGNFLGALISVVNTKALGDSLGKIKVAKTGYAYLYSQKGNYVYYPNAERIGANFRDYVKNPVEIKGMSEEVLAKENGYVNYAGDDGTQKNAAFYVVPVADWKLVVTAPAKEVYASVNRSALLSLVITVIAVLLVVFVSVIMARYIAKPIQDVTGAMKKASTGDLTGRLDTGRKDELGVLAKNINHLLDYFTGIISSVRQKSQGLDNSVTDMSSVADQIASSSQEVAYAIQDAAKGTADQSIKLTETMNLLDRFADAFEEIYNSLEMVKENAGLTERLSHDGSRQLNLLTESIKGTRKVFEAELDSIRELSENIKKIDEITNLINSVSDQTNLLALNAAIEAARAGESGKGFAVVAEEIRKLAEQSRYSSQHIVQIVKTILTGTEGIVTTSGQVNGSLASQIETVELTTELFKKILGSVFETAPKINQTYEKTKEAITARDTVIEKLKNIADISGRTMETTEEISAAAEEMTAATQEIASAAQELKRVSNEMVVSVSTYKI